MRVTSGNAAFGRSPSSATAHHSRQKARRVVESNQVDVVAATVLRDRKEVGHIFETRTSRQVWSDVGQTNRLNRIHLDLTLIHAVAPANLDVGTCPYSDAASDGASSHSLSEPLGEDHVASLRLSVQIDGRARLTFVSAPRADRGGTQAEAVAGAAGRQIALRNSSIASFTSRARSCCVQCPHPGNMIVRRSRGTNVERFAMSCSMPGNRTTRSRSPAT
jgi:hypothetical protein